MHTANVDCIDNTLNTPAECRGGLHKHYKSVWEKIEDSTQRVQGMQTAEMYLEATTHVDNDHD